MAQERSGFCRWTSTSILNPSSKPYVFSAVSKWRTVESVCQKCTKESRWYIERRNKLRHRGLHLPYSPLRLRTACWSAELGRNRFPNLRNNHINDLSHLTEGTTAQDQLLDVACGIGCAGTISSHACGRFDGFGISGARAISVLGTTNHPIATLSGLGGLT